MHLNMSSARWRPFCLGICLLNYISVCSLNPFKAKCIINYKITLEYYSAYKNWDSTVNWCPFPWKSSCRVNTMLANVLPMQGTKWFSLTGIFWFQHHKCFNSNMPGYGASKTLMRMSTSMYAIFHINSFSLCMLALHFICKVIASV